MAAPDAHTLLPNHLTRQAPFFTQAEFELSSLSSEIRRKEHWFVKVADDGIAASWRAEAVGQGLPASHVDRVLEELRHAGARASATNRPAPVDGAFEGDGVLPESMRQRLCAQLLSKAAADGEPDHHPGSEGLAINYVHPSLHCFVPGVTPLHVRHEANDSTRICLWLPAEVAVAVDGTATFASYINGLNPLQHPALYTTLGEVFTRVLPLLERTVGALSASTGLTVQTGRGPYRTPVQQPYHALAGNARLGPFAFETPEQLVHRLQDPVLTYYLATFPELGRNYSRVVDSKGESEAEEDTLWRELLPYAEEFTIGKTGVLPGFMQGPYLALRRLLLQPALPFEPPAPETPYCLRGRTLKVIVKAAAIELSPEQPHYPGGTWHVEGVDAERIVATAIVYYVRVGPPGSGTGPPVLMEACPASPPPPPPSPPLRVSLPPLRARARPTWRLTGRGQPHTQLARLS